MGIVTLRIVPCTGLPAFIPSMFDQALPTEGLLSFLLGLLWPCERILSSTFLPPLGSTDPFGAKTHAVRLPPLSPSKSPFPLSLPASTLFLDASFPDRLPG